jgi:hypothetical protein
MPSSLSLRSALLAALLISLQLVLLGEGPSQVRAEDTKPPAIDPQLAAADQLYRAGKFAEAETRYQALLKTDAKSAPAQVGLIRASRVENRRSNVSLPVDTRRGFRRATAVRFGVVLFPVPDHRTGQADFPHPALGKDTRSSV